jgi:predicted regulator of Ras-like GTPase activity (Roadblock/LC7/MglB family)
MPDSSTKVDFLLNNFVARVPGVRYAVAVSPDGLAVAASSSLDGDDADRLAAVCSGIASLVRGVAAILRAGTVVSNMTHLDDAFVFTMTWRTGASLLVVAATSCDIGVVSYHMTELINQVGDALTPPERQLAAGALR